MDAISTNKPILNIFRNRTFWFVCLLVAFAIIVLRNGWAGDDAYITFRTSFNLTKGFGPVFNIDERVQTFTNPAWMFLMSFFYYFSGEAFFTSILLGFTISLFTVVIFWKMILKNRGLIGIILLFALSKSFVEYSTSGLENPLNHLCLVLFAATFLKEKYTSKTLFLLALIASVGVFNRMDTLLLYAPALLWAFWQSRSWRSLGIMVLGLSPFLLWEGFAVIYYGFPFPNTAYAKLNVYLSSLVMIRQGGWYYLNSLFWDPITLLTVFMGLILAVKARSKSLALAAGLVLYLLYVFKIGGGFMSGRFFSAPFVMGMLLLALHFPKGKKGLAMLILLALFGIFNPRSPLYVTNIPNPPRKGLIDPHGVADERGWYATSASLIYFHSDMRAMKIEGNLDLKSMENRVRQIHFYNTLGFYSYEKGPTIHVLDLWALADPLLSRLPMAWEPDWRIGHFTRILPDGYLESLDTGENKFGDQKLAEFYQKLSIITKGPIWTKERFKEILKFNFGKYDFLINQDYYHKPGPLFVDLEDLNKRQKIGAAFLSPGAVRIWRYRPLRIRMGEKSHHRYFSVSLDNNDLYEFKFFKDGKKISKVVIEPSFLASGGLNTYVLEVGAEAVEQGYDEVWVEGKKGDNWYSIGHFIPVESVSVPDSVGILSE